MGTSTGVFAAIGKPVAVVIPDSPTNAAALEETSTPLLSGTLPIEATTGKAVRVVGKSLMRVDDITMAAGRRTNPLSQFAVTTLTERRSRPYLGE
jgi:hypothetical protein